MAAKAGPKPSRGKSILVLGEKVYANDHILVAAPWHQREGEPYMIARVMEFLPPASYSDPAAASSSKEWDEDRVRVAYYLRQRDITSRYVADFRCILATMHSDVVPVSHVRVKCVVRHRDQIRNLEAFKRQPNAFYWHQFYDRYLHRYFDAIPTDKVTNAPVEVVQHLSKNFDFVLCEVGTGSELTDTSRGCVVCHKWAANNESVTCARCNRVFHLTCLDPPLPQKPKAGYSWSCAPCSKAHEDMVDGHLDIVKASTGKRMVEKGKQASAPNSKDKGKEREALPEDAPMRLTNGWPFRYFGMHTDRYAVLDPHDSLYPRAKTRLGNRYQAVVGIWNPITNTQEEAEAPKPLIKRKEKPSKKGVTASAETIERGEDKVVETICKPAETPEQAMEMDAIVQQTRKLPVCQAVGVDLLDAALSSYSECNDVQSTLEKVKTLKATDVHNAEWSVEDQEKLIEGAVENGNDIEEIAEAFDDKTIFDVTKRYYMTVGAKIQDDVHLQVEEKASAPSLINEQNAKAGDQDDEEELPVENGRRPRRSRASAAAAMMAIAAATAGQAQEEAEDDEEKSVCELDPSEKKARVCATCGETKTTKWWRCPDGVGEMERGADYPRIMCDMCGIRWRHYGTQYPPGPDELKMMTDMLVAVPPPSKKELADKRKKAMRAGSNEDDYTDKSNSRAGSRAPLATTTNATASGRVVEKAKPKTPSPPPVPAKPALTPKPCVMCKRMDPKTHLLQCRRCGLSAHWQCYGPAVSRPESDEDDWFCDMCDLATKRKAIAKHPRCVLCPPVDEEPTKADKTTLSALDVLKPTERLNYVHLLCAVWHQELRFSDGGSYQPVEGISSIPLKRFTSECVICHESNAGAVVKCQDCMKHFHVACAWKAGYKFAFEVFPVKKRQAKEVTTVAFRDESGSIVPCIWCPAHHFNQQTRKTYDIGNRDPASKLTALQIYVHSVKIAHPADTFPLLREAKRLDKLIESTLVPNPPPPAKKAARHSSSFKGLTPILEGTSLQLNGGGGGGRGSSQGADGRPAKRIKKEHDDRDDSIAKVAPWLASSIALPSRPEHGNVEAEQRTS